MRRAGSRSRGPQRMNTGEQADRGRGRLRLHTPPAEAGPEAGPEDERPYCNRCGKRAPKVLSIGWAWVCWPCFDRYLTNLPPK